MKVIRIDDEVWRALQKWASPFEDSPNSVLRRILQIGGTPSKKTASARLPRGQRTPQSDFRRPILRVLYDMKGSGKTADVLDRVEQLIGGKLTTADRSRLRRGEIRWRNTAQFERNAMVDEGLLTKGSQRGVWELTEKGVKLAKSQA
jgi:hypothetical protein